MQRSEERFFPIAFKESPRTGGLLLGFPYLHIQGAGPFRYQYRIREKAWPVYIQANRSSHFEEILTF